MDDITLSIMGDGGVKFEMKALIEHLEQVQMSGKLVGSAIGYP